MPRDFGELDPVPADRGRAEQRDDRIDRDRRPCRRRHRREHGAGRRDEPDRSQDRVGRPGAIGDDAPQDAARDAAGRGDRERESGGDQRPPERAGQVHDEEARQRHLRRRIGPRDPGERREAGIAHHAPDPRQRVPQRDRRISAPAGVERRADRLRRCDHRDAQHGDRDERDAPSCGECERRQRGPGERGAGGHARLFDREDEVHARRGGRAGEHVRRRRGDRSVAQAERDGGEHDQRQRAGAGHGHAGDADRAQGHAGLRDADRAQACDPRARDEARHHRAQVDQPHETADPARGHAEVGRDLGGEYGHRGAGERRVHLDRERGGEGDGGEPGAVHRATEPGLPAAMGCGNRTSPCGSLAITGRAAGRRRHPPRSRPCPS